MLSWFAERSWSLGCTLDGVLFGACTSSRGGDQSEGVQIFEIGTESAASNVDSTCEPFLGGLQRGLLGIEHLSRRSDRSIGLEVLRSSAEVPFRKRRPRRMRVARKLMLELNLSLSIYAVRYFAFDLGALR